MKFGFFAIICIFNSALALGQTAPTTSSTGGVSANQAASDQQSNDSNMAAASATAGGSVMAGFCPQAATHPYAHYVCLYVGPGLIAAGIIDQSIGSGRQGTIDGTSGYNGGGSLGDGGIAGATPPPGTSFGPAIDSAIQTAQSFGVDPTTAAGLAAAAAQAGTGEDGKPQGADMATPEDLAKMDQIMKKVAAKYNVPNLTNFTGGGGGSQKKNSDGADLAALLAGLKDKGRDPASIDGLQKNFNGDAIGVAGDDIFKIITRRYQSKIKDKMFLQIATTGVTAPKRK